MSVDSLHESVVHAFVSAQLRAGPGTQVEPTQTSLTEQNRPSLHGVLIGLAGCVQLTPEHTSLVHWLPSSVQGAPVCGVDTQPLTGLHVSMVHSWPSSQVIVVPQMPPAVQVEPVVQTVLSVQGVPTATGRCWQPPGSTQLSVVHVVPSSQLGGVLAVQKPAWQVSM